MPKDFTARNLMSWQGLVSNYGGSVRPPQGQYFGDSSISPTTVSNQAIRFMGELSAPAAVSAPPAQYYIYPDGNRSNQPGPGAMGPYSDEESLQKSLAIKGIAGSAAQASQSVTDAANTAANPQMITPYARSLSTGGGAYGESDLLGKRTLV